MKHIKKRFYLERPLDDVHADKNYKNVELVDLRSPNIKEKLKKSKKETVYYTKTDGTAYGGFICNIDGQTSVLPIPDPTLVYFDTAHWHLKQIKDRKRELKEKLDLNKELDETGINQVYHFYAATSGFIIFLFTSIESFINQQIPSDYVYKNVLPKRSELYTQEQIYFSVDFETKIKKVLPQVTGKMDYLAKVSEKTTRILNLKHFRDEIIHTKPETQVLNPEIHYEKLITKSLNFDYSKTLDAVASFMNYYKPNYIIECNCGEEY